MKLYLRLRYYKFDGNGNTISQKNATTIAPYPSLAIFEVFPDGNRFITNDKGSIYSKDLVYETALPQGNATFASFCFDNGRAQILAACSLKQIQAYSLNDCQLEKTIKTQGIPFKVFSADGSVICVSTAPAVNGGYYGALSSTTFIETF